MNELDKKYWTIPESHVAGKNEGFEFIEY